MAYAEKVPSPRGDYWRGKYKNPAGAWVSVRDETGKVTRYRTRRDAEKAADDTEAAVRAGRWRDPRNGNITFTGWAQEWYARQDLAASTMANLRRHLEDHLLPFFGPCPLRDIDAALITRWENEERRHYAPSSVRTWRGTLHLILGDAVPAHITVNPASRPRGRGKRSGRTTAGRRGPERVITSPLGVLLIAERMSILTGRDDEFTMVQALYWAALRIGEAIGLERPYVRPASLRVEWQLTEVEGQLVRCPPKDDSYGDVDTPPFLHALLAAHMRLVPPVQCPCHGKAHVFRGYWPPRTRGNMTTGKVAQAAGVSPATAAAAFSNPGRVSPPVRARVLQAAAALGYERPADTPGYHWPRTSFGRLFTAAASARLRPGCGVPLTGDWPGTRVRGPGAGHRAQWCWLPVAPGMSPHGLRHSVKTLMEEQRIPEIMSEAHLRHDLPGVSAVYRHVTPAMRAELTAMMSAQWEAALDARLDMAPSSPVPVLAALLAARAADRRPALVSRESPETPPAVRPLRPRTPSGMRRSTRT
jgi:integrase